MIEKDRATAGLFKIIVILTVIGVCFNFVSFVSPFWLTSKAGEQRPFVRIGLWTVCFNGYMRPYKYDKSYFGCYYIYFYEYDKIREWLNPAWLYAVQTMCSLGLIAHVLSTFISVSQHILVFSHQNLTTIATMIFLNFFTGLAELLALIAFGVESHDSRWFETPMHNTLNWAYAFAVICFLLVFVSFCLCIHLWLKVSYIKKVERIRRLEERKAYYTTPQSEIYHGAVYDPRVPRPYYNEDEEDEA